MGYRVERSLWTLEQKKQADELETKAVQQKKVEESKVEVKQNGKEK